ncbi:MAG TPA: response regulator [Acidimicrobiales bacterium]|nr:response regulator [Acidimicrobiales bacterium]
MTITTDEAITRRTRRVLVVDDDPVIRLIMTVNLEAEGAEVVVAADGFDAVTQALATKPDVIVLDVMMPDCDGLTAVAELKADPRTRHIPVVVLSARASDEERLQGWQAGADHYLTKPFDVQVLLGFLNDVLRNRTPTAGV